MNKRWFLASFGRKKLVVEMAPKVKVWEGGGEGTLSKLVSLIRNHNRTSECIYKYIYLFMGLFRLDDQIKILFNDIKIGLSNQQVKLIGLLDWPGKSCPNQHFNGSKNAQNALF